jgi:diguanylate cyclase (GGDEF)-like protein
LDAHLNTDELAKLGNESIEAYSAGIQANLRKIQARNWWSWSNTVTIVLLLTITIISFSLPGLVRSQETLPRLNLAIRGLVGLVLLFTIYSLWQQLRIKKLCAEIHEKHANAEILYKLAMVDPLTGLYNRRFAEPRMEAEVLRAQRTGSSLTLLLADVDGLKQINDKHGHAAGDAVLRAFADRLKQATRGSDFAARLGGDEFMLLLPGCDLHQLQFVLERLRPFRTGIGGKNLGVEFCCGSYQLEAGQTAEELLQAADEALYKNKRSRRRLPTISSHHNSVHLS